MYVVVRVRGNVHVIPNIKKTLELLALNRCNHCVLVNETVEMKGMLRKAKDYITWGEIDQGTLAKLLQYRIRLTGDKKLTPDIVKAIGFKTHDDLAQAVISNKTNLLQLERKVGIKHVIRLHPPIRGYEGIKRSYRANGALGYRGPDINKLILRMLQIDEKAMEAE